MRWDWAQQSAPVRRWDSQWRVVDCEPVVGLVGGSNGWGAEPGLCELIVERCRIARLDWIDRPLDHLAAEAEGAVTDYSRRRNPDGEYGAALSLISVEARRFSYASIGPASIFVLSTQGLTRLSAGHQFGHYLLRRGVSREVVDQNPQRRIWTESIKTAGQRNYDFGGGELGPDEILVIATPDLAWEIEMGRIEVDVGFGSTDDIAASILRADRSPERADGAARVVVLRH